MNSEVWDYLYLYFMALEESYSKISSLYANPASTSSNEGAQALENSSAMKNTDLFPIYQEIEKNILECQQNIKSMVSEKELKYLICALIFHCDETVLTKKIADHSIPVKNFEWPSLQRKMINCRDGGERFFNYLDKLLQHSRDYKMAIEVYFFCLKRGFLGCYFNHPEQIQNYLNRCSEVIKRNATLLNLNYGSTTLAEYKFLRDALRNKKNKGADNGAAT